jgi:hypothetical protein
MAGNKPVVVVVVGKKLVFREMSLLCGIELVLREMSLPCGK